MNKRITSTINTIISVLTLIPITSVYAQVTLPNIFNDNMVLQQNLNNSVWGKAEQGEKITVTIANQSHTTHANSNGDWRLKLKPLKAGGPYKLEVAGDNTISYNNVLVGEVWLCSGQSNMGWRVSGSNHAKLEMASANYPELRLITIPRVGIDKPQFNVDAKWLATTPDSVGDFSATCYFYGRRLHQTLGVPVGLINTAWGGSPVESFIARDKLEQDPQFDKMLANWDQQAASFTEEKLARDIADYEAWIKKGKPGKKRFLPQNVLTGKKRPANIFNGMINPIIGYGIKGAIWCQGESNLGRAAQYRALFPLLINSWRAQWKQGDFPFYWVQLADFNNEVLSPSKNSNWALLREAQTMTLALPNTGEAIVYDLGEAKDIHPRNKQEAANRLVRHPLVKDYGYDMNADSPRYDAIEFNGNKVIITFKNVGTKLYAFDTDTIVGFAIAGIDKKFINAQAKIISKNKIAVSAKEITMPVAIRYGWEDNPIVNLYDKSGLPVTPFRSDAW
ncbi:MAG: sialate O-acetylesterase [Thalassotalea sp.]